jgi:hypothetical protein
MKTKYTAKKLPLMLKDTKVILKACAKKKLSCKLESNFEMKEHKFEKRKNLERLFWNDNIRHLA